MPARILVVALERVLFDRIDPLLSRAHFEVDRVPRGAAGTLLSENVKFDLMVVRHPLPDMSLEVFCASVRKAGSPSVASQLLVLTESDRVSEAQALAPRHASLVLSITDPKRLLEEVASRLLGVEPRVATRLMIRMQVGVAAGKTLVMCQSENVSQAGMLLRTDRDLPIGTRVTFETTIPGDRDPIQGEAMVVRHTAPDVEDVRGIGFKFLAFRGDGEQRFRAFVSRTAPPPRQPQPVR
jgi:hypothetical protein